MGGGSQVSAGHEDPFTDTGGDTGNDAITFAGGRSARRSVHAMIPLRKDIFFTPEAFERRLRDLKAQAMHHGSLLATFNSETGLGENLAGMLIEPPQRVPLEKPEGQVLLDPFTNIEIIPYDLARTLGHSATGLVGLPFVNLIFRDEHDPPISRVVEKMAKVLHGKERAMQEPAKFVDRWGRPLHVVTQIALRPANQGLCVEYLEMAPHYWELAAAL